MPIAVKLSRDFYDRFGDKAVDELVGLLNQVDAASQHTLREFNEQNFARFDATLEQRIAELRGDVRARIAELDAKIDRRIAELRGDVQARIAELDAKIDRRIAELRGDLQARIAELDAKIDSRIAELRGDFQARIAELDAKIDSRIARLEAKLSGQLVSHMRWTIGILLMQFAAVIGLWFRH